MSTIISQGLGSTLVMSQGYGAAVAPPVAEFMGDPLSGTAPLEVEFVDLSTGSPTSWLWDFGDGDTSTDQNPTHTYAAAGSYTVSLTASNAGGSSQEVKVAYVSVAPAPVPAPGSAAPSGLREDQGAAGGWLVPPSDRNERANRALYPSSGGGPFTGSNVDRKDPMEEARKLKRKKTRELVAVLELMDMV
jgi:hypothetical protein